MFLHPTPTDLSGLWETVKENENFVLQKLKEQESALWKTVLATIQNVFDTKQPPFRIVLRGAQSADSGYMVSAGESLKAAQKDFQWIEENLMKELMDLEDADDKEAYAISKFQSLVTSVEKDTDEKSSDAKFRAASRAWRQIFRLPENERLVNCKNGVAHLMNQGWMYISMSYVCFYSFVFGAETKIVLELKDIETLSKEKSKRGVFADAIQITMKNKTEHIFSNLFSRDETFDLIEYLTNLSMQRLLRVTSTDPAPGLTANEQDDRSLAISPDSPLSLRVNKPLKQIFEDQKKNSKYQNLFSLPSNEALLIEMTAICTIVISGAQTNFHGKIYLSNTFFCFNSTAKYQCQLVLPFFAVKRVERINSQNSTIAITVWHQVKLLFQLIGEKAQADSFCTQLRDRLQEHVKLMKSLKTFLATCVSEDVLADREVTKGGLGLKYGYVDTKKTKEKNKLKYWVAYMKASIGTHKFCGYRIWSQFDAIEAAHFYQT
ncbi:TBC1 domain member 9, partial [Blyttiomyces sp. JEL0837]